jgi:hypothetical protein
MKAFLFPLAILASSAVAQTTTACAADYIVESCLSTEKAKLESCGHEDWTCRCAGWNAILTYALSRGQLIIKAPVTDKRPAQQQVLQQLPQRPPAA